MEIILPEHYEVVVQRPDSTAVKYCVIASSEDVAVKHIERMHPDDKIVSEKTKHVQSYYRQYEVAEG
jgi:predicted glycosyltransferase